MGLQENTSNFYLNSTSTNFIKKLMFIEMMGWKLRDSLLVGNNFKYKFSIHSFAKYVSYIKIFNKILILNHCILKIKYNNYLNTII